jgi:hypothetical protein
VAGSPAQRSPKSTTALSRLDSMRRLPGCRSPCNQTSGPADRGAHTARAQTSLKALQSTKWPSSVSRARVDSSRSASGMPRHRLRGASSGAVRCRAAIKLPSSVAMLSQLSTCSIAVKAVSPGNHGHTLHSHG